MIVYIINVLINAYARKTVKNLQLQHYRKNNKRKTNTKEVRITFVLSD